MSAPTIGFAGMTHLGLNSAAAAAARGFATVGFDPEAPRVEALQAGTMPVREPDLQRCIAEHAERLTFTADAAALAVCDVVYVAADVPTDDDGTSDLTDIRTLIEMVRPRMAASATLVVLSQVPPGFTRSLGLPAATTFYQVETLIFGRAIERAMHPERHIIGCAAAEEPLPKAYTAFLEAHDCPILPMRYESAELAKISINCCLVASVSVTNTLAELCEQIGADWEEIVPALKLDRRIGPHAYLDPGLGIAGGNLERDLVTVCNLAEERGTDSDVIRAFISNSGYRKAWPLRMFHAHVAPRAADPVVAVLGLTYKENTHSTKNSPAVALIRALDGVTVRAYDPVATLDPAWSRTAVACDNPLDACAGADALFVMTKWKVFRQLDPVAVAERLRGDTVVDPYRLLEPQACARTGLRQIALGIPAPAGPDDDARYRGD